MRLWNERIREIRETPTTRKWGRRGGAGGEGVEEYFTTHRAYISRYLPAHRCISTGRYQREDAVLCFRRVHYGIAGWPPRDTADVCIVHVKRFDKISGERERGDAGEFCLSGIALLRLDQWYQHAAADARWQVIQLLATRWLTRFNLAQFSKSCESNDFISFRFVARDRDEKLRDEILKVSTCQTRSNPWQTQLIKFPLAYFFQVKYQSI